MSEYGEKLGQKLKELREAHFPGEGLRRIAPKIHIDFTHLGKIESGESLPSVEVIKKIAELYNLTKTEFSELYEVYSKAKVHQTLEEVDSAAQKQQIPSQKLDVFFRKSRKEQK